MKDGLVRKSLKLVARGCFQINLLGTRLLWWIRGDKPWKLGGECGKCAACCETPGIQTGRLIWYIPSLRWLFLAWHRHVNGFELIERDPIHRVFIFRCSHFDWETRRCDSYESRPGMCRAYPRTLMWQAYPEMLPPCGYHPVDPKGKQLLSALEKENLSPEQLEKIKKRLHLED